jgi:hypothetical protein
MKNKRGDHESRSDIYDIFDPFDVYFIESHKIRNRSADDAGE